MNYFRKWCFFVCVRVRGVSLFNVDFDYFYLIVFNGCIVLGVVYGRVGDDWVWFISGLYLLLLFLLRWLYCVGVIR